MSISGRFKWYVWFVVLVLLGVFFSSLFRPERVRSPWYREIAVTAVSPLNKGAVWIFRAFRSILDRYIFLLNVSKENDILKAELKDLHSKLIHLNELAAENERLLKLVGMASKKELKIVGSRVIANDPRQEFKTITLDKGFDDGVRKGMVVLGPSGLVGRIGEVGGNWARVLLITDPNSFVDAMVERTRQRVILVGAMRSVHMKPGYYLTRLEYVHRTSDINDGDVLVTSGVDGVFPKGIPIGIVKDLTKDDSGLFLSAEVLPFEDIAALQEVGIVIGADRRG